jgi:hemerythrin
MEVSDGHFIVWEERYTLGIPLLDAQHKELFDLTNELYAACLEGDSSARSSFIEAVHSIVEYVHRHCSAEERIFENINYPKMAEHKKEHASFIKRVLEDVKDFESGKSFVPNAFVRFLRDWALAHIAFSDKEYAEYIMRLKKEGKLKINL